MTHNLRLVAALAVCATASATGCQKKAPANAAKTPSAHNAAANNAGVGKPAPAANTAPKGPNMATQPGAIAYKPELNAKIAAAAKALPKDFRPRTRHYNGAEHKSKERHPDPYAPAGSKPNFTNRLILETSPYLRQHANNPVDWRPWGPEAFAEARKLGRPVFLSVGYSTCHWCHVMEHESFEDLEIANMLNTMYVPIKVDREERPDVDAIYMAAVHALHGNGGWPMSVWIDPGQGGKGKELHGLPFFAGTYFPPRAGVRGRRRGFLEIARELAETYVEDRANIANKGEVVATRIRNNMASQWKGPMVTVSATNHIANIVRNRFDSVHGGTKRAPKFPSNIPHSVLLRHWLRTGDQDSLKHSHFTLEKMSAGGIYDHVGGGFARYSTDARWLVPHFEKMLYDQALIGRALVDAFIATGDEQLAYTLRETLDYLLREMRHTSGGKPAAFYSATDADSEGKEGKFFLWTTSQLREVLGPDDAKLVGAIYDVTDNGNFEHSNILNLQQTWGEYAKKHAELKLDAKGLRAKLRGLLDKLYAKRKGRIPPLRDDKILVSWNGLIIGTFAYAGFVLDEPKYIQAAREASDYILAKMRDKNGRLLRTAYADRARFTAYLDDYAFFIQGLLDLYEATGEGRWLTEALALQGKLDLYYADRSGGAYFATATDGEPLLAREKPDYDGAEPSGNSIAAGNLVRLWALTGDGAWRGKALACIGAFSRRLGRWPLAMSEMLIAVEAFHWPIKEVVVVRPKGSQPAVAKPMLGALRKTFMPHRVVMQVEEGAHMAAIGKITPLVREKVARGGKVTAYVCTAGICKLPTTDPKVMIKQLKERPAPPK